MGTCNIDDFAVGFGFIGPLDDLPQLHFATALGDRLLVQQLIDQKTVDLKLADREGKRPLHWAAGRGHAPLTQLLLQSRADPKVEDMTGASAAHLASFEGHISTVKHLIKASARLVSATT